MKKDTLIMGASQHTAGCPLPITSTVKTGLFKQSLLRAILCSFVLTVLIHSVPLAQTTDLTVFPLNEYLCTQPDGPYPCVNKDKIKAIDTSKFVSVMQFGAKGDGRTLDDVAIANAFKSAQYGVIFPAGKTFLVGKLSKIILTHDLTIYAYGAVIKMADFTRYSFLNLEFKQGSYQNSVIWLGGTLDGNKKKQAWVGSPNGRNYWEEEHGRFVGVNYAQLALFKDVSIVNTVMDGIGLESNRIAVISDCKATGGAPLKYSEVQDQGTYFKCTRAESHAFYCNNLISQGGSIGIQYSTSNGTASDSSLCVITNCKFSNQSQDAIHFEDCKKVFLYKDSIESKAEGSYNEDVHISNATIIASLKSCYFKNARVDFNNSKSLKLGFIDSCQFLSDYMTTVSGIATFIVGRPTICTNSSFSGKTTLKYQGALKNVRNCTFSNFDSLAVSGAYAVDSCIFINGIKPASLSKGGFIINSTYSSVQTTEYEAKPADPKWQDIYLSYIDILSDANLYLGRIGYTGKTTDAANKQLQNAQVGLTTNTLDKFKTDERQTTLLYPNPCQNEARLQLGAELTGEIALHLFDVNGKVVKFFLVYKKAGIASQTIDVSSLKNGSYILSLRGSGFTTSLPLIVMK